MRHRSSETGHVKQPAATQAVLILGIQAGSNLGCGDPQSDPCYQIMVRYGSLTHPTSTYSLPTQEIDIMIHHPLSTIHCLDSLNPRGTRGARIAIHPLR